MLAQIYTSENQGLPQDYAKSLMWNEKAAAQGSALAHLNIGLMYRDGAGVPKDAAKALDEFTMAANFYQEGAARGDITSQFYLGRAIKLGKGVPQDYAQALAWYGKSAERDNHVASVGMLGLASLYERGLGVTQDLQRAIALYQQAAATGNEDAQKALQRLGVR